MGCVSSHLLNQDDDFTQISHHIVSLTSTTYGLLTLDPSSSPTTVAPTPPRFTLGSIFNTPSPDPRTEPHPEVIDSRELMAGLDFTPERFNFSPQPSKPSSFRYTILEKDEKFQEKANPYRKDPIFIKSVGYKPDLLNGFEENKILEKDPKFQENANPNCKDSIFVQSVEYKPDLLDGCEESCPLKGENSFLEKELKFQENATPNHKNPEFLNGFEEICPPKGENRVVIYTTSLRGVRKTFEACNAVRAVLEGFGVSFCERDISMDRGFKEELWELMKGKDKHELVPPRVFVKGRYVGGCDEVLKIVEEGCLGQLLEGLPKSKAGYVCEVCGGARFLPCVVCNGSCKVVVVLKKEIDEQLRKSVTVKCSDCNENGLVCCPICS